MRFKSKQTGVTDDQPLILVVDDDDGVSTLIEKRLRANGFRTHRTCDGSETLKWLCCNKPDLLLLDHKLPDMTGKEIIEQLTNRAPFIIVSAQGGERFIVEMMKFGALDYIVKDTAFLDLLPSVVNRALEQVKQIAELAKRKEALQWELSVNKAIAKLSDTLLNQKFSIEEISDLVLEPAKELTKSRFGYVGYIDDRTGYLVCPTLTKDVWKQCQMSNKDIVFKKFGGIWGWGLDNRKSVMVNSLSCDQRSTGTPKGHIPIERFLAVPSLIEDKLVGQIAVANSERDYTDRDERLLARLADIYALALQRKNSEDSLRQSEQRYRSVTQSAVDAIISADSDGKIVSWNYGGKKIFGYTEEEIVGKSVTVLMPEKYAKGHQAAVDRIHSGGEACLIGRTLELCGLRKDGSEFPLALSLSNWKSGEEEFYTGIIRDITEQKQNEERVAELARFPAENPNPVLRSAGDGTVTYCNKAGAFLLESWSCQQGGVLPEYWNQFVLAALKSRLPQQIEADCGEKSFTLTFAPITDSNYVNIYGYDITERKQAENALIEAEEEIHKFKTIADNANYGVAISDCDGVYMYVNKYFAEVHGYSVDEVIGQSLTLLHNKEQLPQVLEVFRKLKKTGSLSAKESWHERKDGAIFPVLVNGITIKNEEGEPLYIATTAIDISERKWASEEVERLAKFPDQNPSPVLRISANGLIIYNNKASLPLLKAWQCRRDESVPLKWRKCVQETLSSNRTQRAVVECGQKIFSLVFAPVVESEYVNVYGHDVTDRQMAQKELDKINKELEARVKKRTAQLQRLVSDLQGEVTNRIKAERVILDDQKQLRQLTSELLLIEERERRKIATELHDSIGQILAFSSIELANFIKSASSEDTKPLAHVRKMIEQAIAETRTLTFDLSPTVLYTFGLEAAVEHLAEQFSGEHGFQCHFDSCLQDKPISDEVQILLYRSVRELLVNIAKHARASNVKVDLSRNNNHFQIKIEDDGVGFDTSKLNSPSMRHNRFGLLSVRERLSHFDGSFDIQSDPGKGTKVKLLVPLEG